MDNTYSGVVPIAVQRRRGGNTHTRRQVGYTREYRQRGLEATGAPMNVSRQDWSRPRTYAEGKARLIGRTRYHEARRRAKGERGEVVYALLLSLGWNRWGVLGEIATQLGVSRSCICKDRQRLERSMLGL